VFVTKLQLFVVLIVILVIKNVIILITCLGLYAFNYTKFKNIITNITVTMSVSFNNITLLSLIIILYLAYHTNPI